MMYLAYVGVMLWCYCWNYACYSGIQKSLRSDFDMAYERGRISVSAEDGEENLLRKTPPAFTRVSFTLFWTHTNMFCMTVIRV